MLISCSSMQALVTGCAGFIGSHLCERLLAEGHAVVGVDGITDSYDPQVKLRNLELSLEHGDFRFVRSDIVGLDASVLQDADVIFHLAARPGVRNSWGQAFEGYVHDNILATQHLLECASHAAGLKRVVLASSSSVYGNTDAERVKEDHPPNPISPYGVTKLASEQLCSAYCFRTATPSIILRLFTVYGPRQRPDMAFHRLIRAALTGKKFVLYGDGAQRRDFTFVLDAVEALLLAWKAPARSNILNIAGAEIVSANEAIGLVEEIVGARIEVERAQPQSGDVRNTGADLSRSRDQLGYTPRVGLREGLQKQTEFVEQTLRAAASSS